MTAPVATVPPVSTSATSGDRPAAREWAVIRPLARIEARRLSLRSAVLLGYALSLMYSLLSGAYVVDFDGESINMGFAALPLAAITLVSSHRAVCRPRRHGAEELFEATPSPERARTAAHLLAVVPPALVAALFVAVAMATRPMFNATAGSVRPAELVVGPLMVAGAGALGVLLARLWPRPLVPFVACFAIALVELQLISERFVDGGYRFLAFWVEGSLWYLLPERPAVAHAVYLAGLVALACLAALLRHGVTRRLTIVSLATIAVTLGAAVVQTRPPSRAEWAAANQLVANPEGVHRCETRDGARYCAFPGAEDLMRAAQEPLVRSIRDRVPARAWPRGIVVAHRVSASDLQYGGAVARELRDLVPALEPRSRQPMPDDGRIHVAREFGWGPAQVLGFAVSVASRVVGLPTGVGEDRAVCSAAGQARAAVVLWLAAGVDGRSQDWLGQITDFAASAPAGSAGEFTVVEQEVYGGASFGAEDGRLALGLLRRPRAEVRATIDRNWERLVDPATTTEAAAEFLGVSGVRNGSGPRVDKSINPIARIDGRCA